MAGEPTNKSSGVNKVLLVIIGILLVINAVQFYLYKEKESSFKEIHQNQKAELINTYTKLDSISTQLTAKIDEIEALGGNIDSLLIVQAELEKDKATLKSSKTLAQTQYFEIKDKIEGYEYLLKQKDKEIATLKDVNEELLSEVIGLKTERNELNSTIYDLKETTSELQTKVQSASVLKAENILLTAINNKGKERTETEFRVKHIETLKVVFDFAKNNVAEIGTKEIALRIIEPGGSVLYKVGGGNNTFKYQGKDLFFSDSRDVLFDNSQQTIDFAYKKGSDFKRGAYKVELYSQGELIGLQTFIVK